MSIRDIGRLDIGRLRLNRSGTCRGDQPGCGRGPDDCRAPEPNWRQGVLYV